MPELPEVETTARGLRPHLVGRRISSVGQLDWPNMLPNVDPDRLVPRLTGRLVEAVWRRGKYLVLQLSDGATLVIHRKMTGNLVLRAPLTPPQPHTHLVLSFEDGPELHFVDPRKFGRIYYFHDPAELDRFFAERLGPEPLEGLTASRLAELLRGRKRSLKALLLDQAFLAGLGNLYADEVLWLARLHPRRTAAGLTPDEIGVLADAIREVLEGAIARRGTSLSDYVDAAGEPGENQSHLMVYGRTGLPCPRCGTSIERRVLAQRGTWLCATCQIAPC